MRILPTNIDNFINKTPANIKFILIFGQDLGLIKNRAQQLANNFLGKDISNPFRYFEIDFDSANSTNQFFDYMNSISFGGNFSVIRIFNMSPSLNKDISNFIKDYQGNNIAIFTAEDLPPASSTRKFFETTENIASIACYKDEGIGLKRLIINKLRAEKINFSDEVVSLLEYRINGDRDIINQEIEKISTFAINNKNLTPEIIEEITTSSIDLGIDDFCMYCLIKDTNNSLFLLDKLSESTSAITILRAMYRSFSKLLLIISLTSQNKDFETAANSIKPPIFYKQKNYYKEAIRKWEKEELLEFLSKILDLELAFKGFNSFHKESLSNLIISYKFSKLSV